eukprot:13497262-Heterocapsa_arctica.AAC.1
MILDKIEEQSCLVCVMENENRERDEEDLGHDGEGQQACRGDPRGLPAARPRSYLASQGEEARPIRFRA